MPSINMYPPMGSAAGMLDSAILGLAQASGQAPFYFNTGIINALAAASTQLATNAAPARAMMQGTSVLVHPHMMMRPESPMSVHCIHSKSGARRASNLPARLIQGPAATVCARSDLGLWLSRCSYVWFDQCILLPLHVPACGVCQSGGAPACDMCLPYGTGKPRRRAWHWTTRGPP